MDLSEKFTAQSSAQDRENNQLRLMNTQKQDENIKLLFDLTLIKADYEKEKQIRSQYEKQLNEAKQIIEQVYCRVHDYQI